MARKIFEEPSESPVLPGVHGEQSNPGILEDAGPEPFIQFLLLLAKMQFLLDAGLVARRLEYAHAGDIPMECLLDASMKAVLCNSKQRMVCYEKNC